MRHLTLAAGAACALLMLNSASAQNGAPVVGGTSMPGQVVGGYTGTVNSVGTKAPAAAPAAGLPITSNPLIRPYDPNDPYAAFKGTNIDTKQIIAPLVGADGRPVKPPGALDPLTDKLKAIFGLLPAPPARPPYAPGISRRNRERINEHLWRRD
jgi:hypothetical protein